MTDLNKVIAGLRRYLEAELIDRVTGYQKWLVGAGLSMALDNGIDLFNQVKENPFIKTMGLVNDNDEIDVDKIYKYLNEQARKSAVTFKLPLIGSITLKSDDVEKIYNYIVCY